MNTVQLIGRLTAAPELRRTPQGTAVASATLAVDDGFGTNKKTFFFGITFWGKTAETAEKYAVKGQRIGVAGRLSQDEYTPKGTEKPVRKTHVTCERLTLLDKPQGHDRGTNSPGQRSDAPQGRTEARTALPRSDDQDVEEIPF